MFRIDVVWVYRFDEVFKSHVGSSMTTLQTCLEGSGSKGDTGD